MTAYANQVKSYIERYQAEVGGDSLLDPHAVAEWAYRNGLHKPSVRTVVDAIAVDIAQHFREDYRTDATGQRYRAMHAVRSKRGDKTMSLWADMDDERAPRDHFVRSFAQRRQQIVGDCFQLKTDVDVYNAKDSAQMPIQMPLDFTLDVEELQLPFHGKRLHEPPAKGRGMNIADAIQNRNLLSFIYDGFRRTVEPHTYGIDTKGHMALRAHQVGGGSKSGEYVGWKIFHVQDMLHVNVQPQIFASPRDGYKRNDKAFVSIKAQL